MNPCPPLSAISVTCWPLHTPCGYYKAIDTPQRHCYGFDLFHDQGQRSTLAACPNEKEMHFASDEKDTTP